MDISKDQPEIHPQFFCVMCQHAVQRITIKSKQTATTTDIVPSTTGGCGPVYEWEKHRRLSCPTCSLCEQKPKAGRPPKCKRSSITACTDQPATQVDISCSTSDVSSSTEQRTATPPLQSTPSHIHAVNTEEIAKKSTPSYRTDMLLSRSRFIDSNAVQSCNICEHIVDEAVYALRCEELFCSKCICSWLSTHSTCPICKVELTNASIASPPRFVKRMIESWTVMYDYYAPALVGCQSTVPLSQLRQHAEECPHNPSSSATPIRAVGPSSRAGDTLSASPSKMKGNLGQRIGVHVIKSNMKDGFAELSNGHGKPLTVAALPSPATSSDNWSVRTQSRRDELMRKVQKVAGGADGARARQVAGLQRMSKEKQQALLKEAGIIGHSPGRSTLLAIKADLNLPWYQIRKLKCWLREFGVQLESERTARSFIASTIPAYTATEVPLTKRNGDIVLAAAVYFPNLIDLITHYLDMYRSCASMVVLSQQTRCG